MVCPCILALPVAAIAALSFGAKVALLLLLLLLTAWFVWFLLRGGKEKAARTNPSPAAAVL